ncbi:protein ROOT HAIR DEFECTIVE 3 [Artemisia annua]|uniref:Protein ROOT HAIR DEFECTIVE 3 n=1 Tax=Artemisia annua TaxID=35608 RepID=A0A2U1NK06_ARTAN|nr:protein ROOT HAIR DEFECTIVE 3 [Artemisia annua]
MGDCLSWMDCLFAKAEGLKNEIFGVIEQNCEIRVVRLQELEEAVQSHIVPGFGKKLSSLLYKRFQYVRSSKRKQWEHIRSGALNNFEKPPRDALNSGQGFATTARDCINKFANYLMINVKLRKQNVAQQSKNDKLDEYKNHYPKMDSIKLLLLMKW